MGDRGRKRERGGGGREREREGGREGGRESSFIQVVLTHCLPREQMLVLKIQRFFESIQSLLRTVGNND